MQKNPVIQAREAMGLSRSQFAAAIGAGYNAVAAVEVGNNRVIPKTWASGLEAIGLDYSELDQAYRAFRSELAAAATGKAGA